MTGSFVWLPSATLAIAGFSVNDNHECNNGVYSIECSGMQSSNGFKGQVTFLCDFIEAYSSVISRSCLLKSGHVFILKSHSLMAFVPSS